jgi:hypothetical protein
MGLLLIRKSDPKLFFQQKGLFKNCRSPTLEKRVLQLRLQKVTRAKKFSRMCGSM